MHFLNYFDGRPSKTYIGPLTRAMAKRVQEEEGSLNILLLWKLPAWHLARERKAWLEKLAAKVICAQPKPQYRPALDEKMLQTREELTWSKAWNLLERFGVAVRLPI
ncbi:hypothetical protein LR48_Vigan07g148700 [Vigna angularis]|uniref:Uncharacterized protein n=1 Tax=Phaseolus angularis TaxID=3914 RepID=A0A0L9UYC4_PHAAN|nr:hypothetical protein LR48_Vigan07g148700 [Vigna angularis]